MYVFTICRFKDPHDVENAAVVVVVVVVVVVAHAPSHVRYDIVIRVAVLRTQGRCPTNYPAQFDQLINQQIAKIWPRDSRGGGGGGSSH